MIGAGLGQLFLVNLQRRRESGKVKVDQLLPVGLGEPGRFAADGLRFLMSNVTVALKAVGQHHVSTQLIGTRRNSLPVEQAARAFLEGALDGYDRFHAIAEGVTDDFPRYGAVGTFGLQGSGPDITDGSMLAADADYGFRPGKVYNLSGNSYIRNGGGFSGAHSDITGPEAAHTVWEPAGG